MPISVITGASVPAGPTTPSERIHTLDILRGLALFGMIVVHFFDQTGNATDLGTALQTGVSWLVESKSASLFAFLFGVGFALQLQRAEARGEDQFTGIFLRRLAVLFLFGFVAEAGFGYNVLIGYALWGVPLLLVRRWSTRSLLLLALLCTTSQPIYHMVRGSHLWLTVGPEGARAVAQANGAALRENWALYEQLQAQTNYVAVVGARLWKMTWFYAQPFFFTPSGAFPKFLLGMVALRIGLFAVPRQHLRLVLGMMAFGIFSWALATFVLPLELKWIEFRPVGGPLGNGLRLFRDEWLMFTFMGAVLLVSAYAPRWLRSLGAVAVTGRMALTNYLLQVIALDLIFSNYALGLTTTPLLAIVGAVLMFGSLAAFSAWWLAHYRFGPAEWLWRTLAYGRMQPMRIAKPAPAILGA